MSENKKDNYYWVKFVGNWEIALYDKEFDCWMLCGTEETFEYADFESVGPKVNI